MVVQAGGAGGAFTDVDEAAAIVYAVDHGAKIVNLSLGGPTTSSIEKRAVDYAISKGALLVAAVGNGYLRGNDGRVSGGAAAAARLERRRRARALGRRLDAAGRRAPLLQHRLACLARRRPASVSSAPFRPLRPLSSYPRTALPGSVGGVYGYGSGTSFAAPQVAGAAALVWAANPELRARRGGVDPRADGVRPGPLERRARLRRPRRRRGGREGAGDAVRPAPAVAAAEPAPVVRCGCTGSASARASLSGGARRVSVARFRVSVRSRAWPAARSRRLPRTRRSARPSPSLGGAYGFTVAALDADGRAARASRRPWSVDVPRAARR